MDEVGEQVLIVDAEAKDRVTPRKLIQDSRSLPDKESNP